MQDNLNETASDQAGDPVFQQEQDHLSDTYAKLEAIAKNLSEKMERRRWQAAKDKDDMQGEVKHNFASDGEAQETYVDYAVLNNLIRDYNLEQDADSERLAAAAKLLEQPYFAKISLEMRTGAPDGWRHHDAVLPELPYYGKVIDNQLKVRMNTHREHDEQTQPLPSGVWGPVWLED